METTNTLGFYYLIFQQFSDRYVRCWFDGSEDSTLVDKNTFLKYAEAFNDVLDIRRQLDDALCTTSIYFLDVEGNKVSRLRARPDERKDSSDMIKILETKKEESLSVNKTNFFIHSLDMLHKLF